MSDRAIPRGAQPGPIRQVGPTLRGAARWYVVSLVLALIGLPRASLPLPDAVPLLVALAAGCAVGLTVRRAPSLAWLAAIAGSFAAASVPIRLASAADPGTVGLAPWLAWAIPAGVAALITMVIAAGYATRAGRRVDHAAPFVAVLVTWFAISVAVTIVAVLAGQRSDPAFTWVDVASLPIAWFRPFVAVLVGLGAVADLRDGLLRARERVPVAATSWDLGLATVRELIPGQLAAEESRAVAERRHIAGDLHASVVPSLRRAIEEAEGGGDPARVLKHLRAADLELERLMTDRWPIVLETFGLVTALEDLAERLEAGGSPPIGIEIERSDGRPPRDVERAAWRFAQVALDNAVRHAGATSIEVTVAVTPGAAALVVGDDGRGIDLSGERRRGGRGLADAAAGARQVGASVRFEPRPQGGTAAAFDWRRSPG